MIGAAGARRFAAGERAGLDLDARPSLPLARGERAGPRASIPSEVRAHAAGGRPARPPRPVAELPGRRRRARGILAAPTPCPATGVLEIGPGLGLLTGGLLGGRRAGDGRRARPRAGGVPARALRAPPLEAGQLRPHRGRRPRPGPRPPRPAAVRRRGEPAVPHHQPDPARPPGRAAAPASASC